MLDSVLNSTQNLLSAKTVIGAIGYGCLGLSALFAVMIGERLWPSEQDLTMNILQDSSVNETNESSSKLEDFSVIVDRNVFGKYPEKVKDTPPVKKSDLKLRLVGTNLGKVKFAVIENKKSKEQDIFELDDMIFESGAQLKEVSEEKIKISKSGEIEVLEIEGGASTGDSSSGGSAPDEDSTEFEVDEKELNDALSNLPKLLTQARAVPFFKNGKSIGMRLFAIRRGSLYEKLGLKNGDILLSVNDNSLANPAEALKLFEKLKDERAIAVLVERNGAEVDLRYGIK